MQLIELRPQWLKINDETHFQYVPSIVDADGLIFLCPLCMQNNSMNTHGVHSVICWRPPVPQTISPIPGRWEFQGTRYEDLTLIANSSSVQLTSGCMAHFHITNGAILFC